ncbi:hypothetical protein H6F96_14025 [Microcoleus sp. FACHB-53]|jgi:hypothetical protein|nr:hypothetical protein [Microcoleus sp. FACHB-53]MBD2125081.1 hypothetical protein [Microcoleus sp. FACHB-1]
MGVNLLVDNLASSQDDGQQPIFGAVHLITEEARTSTASPTLGMRLVPNQDISVET